MRCRTFVPAQREAAVLVAEVLARSLANEDPSAPRTWHDLFTHWGFRFAPIAGFVDAAAIVEEVRLGWVLFYDPDLPEDDKIRQFCHEAAEYILAARHFLEGERMHHCCDSGDRHQVSMLVVDMMFGPAIKTRKYQITNI